MRADESFHDEAHHIDLLKGHVIFNGYAKAVPSWRIVCDLLILPSGPSNELGVSNANKVTWEGHVFIDHGDDAARADYAYYDFSSKTLTLTGHVAVEKGRWVVRNDRLAIDAKDLWRILPGRAPRAQADAPNQPNAPGASGDPLVRVAEDPLIDQVKFRGNRNLKDRQLREVVEERAGSVFRWAKGGADADHIIALYESAGWRDASAKVTITDLPNKRVDLVFVIDEGSNTGPPPPPILLPKQRREAGDDHPGPVSITADRVSRYEDQHRVEWAGNVVTWQDGRRVASDLLNIYAYGQGEPGGPGLKEARWEGHVLVDQGDGAASADQAEFDARAKTLTLSGNVVVQRGPWIVKHDRLVIDVRYQ
jgi:lipopolysaccharide export system protein LptA